MGDPPNIIVASRAGLTFNDFMLHLTSLVVIVLIALIAVLPRLFARSRSEAEELPMRHGARRG